MEESLFLASPPKFEKLALQYTLSQSPDMWADELLSALLDEFPFLGNYVIDVSMLGQDEKSGYAYGYFTASPNKPEPSQVGSSRIVPHAGGPTVRIPFVVSRRKLRQLAVFLDPRDGKAYPLSQRRVDAALQSGEAGRVNQGTNYYANEGVTSQTVPPEEMSKTGSLCRAVGSVMNRVTKTKFAHLMTVDPEVLYGLESNDAFLECVSDMMSAETKTASQVRAAVLKNLPVDAVLIEKSADGYRMTSDCSKAYLDGSTEIVGDLPKGTPKSLIDEVEKVGYAVRARAAVPAVLPTEVVKVATSGAYEVQTGSGKKPAYIFDKVTDLYGTPQESMLVKTGAAYSYEHGDVIGVPLSDIPHEVNFLGRTWEDLPRGKGFFITKEGAATTPINIDFYETGADVVANCSTPAGKVKLAVKVGTEEDSGILKISAGYGIIHPKTLARFVPIGDHTQVISEKETVTKLANLGNLGKEVKITYSSGEYSLVGEPLQKVGSITRELNAPRAMYFLSLAGVPPTVGKAKMAEAKVLGTSTLYATRPIIPYHEIVKEAKAAVLPLIEMTPRDDYTFVKCAAVFRDKKTVDTVLGLNFITPDTLSVFISYLPEISETLHKLCELLVAVQLGVQDIPESAVYRAIRTLDTVTAGLELLKLRGGEQ